MSTAVATTEPKLASVALAERLGMTGADMINAFKAQCFLSVRDPASITREQLISFVNIASTLNLNPLLPGMMYAYPGRNGSIVPMIGPDGMFKILAEHPDVDHWTVEIEDDANGKPVSALATIFMRHSGPRSKRVWLSEWKMKDNPNWNTRERHMLEIRAIKQCARQVIHGLPYDEDERRIMEQTEKAQPEHSAAAINAALEASPLQTVRSEPTVVEAELVPSEPIPDAEPKPTPMPGPEIVPEAGSAAAMAVRA